MPVKGTVAAQKQRKRKAERSRECGSEFTQGMLFQRQGQRGSKRAAMHWWDRERKLREGQISYVRGLGPSYIGLYQRGWSHPIRGCVGAVGALCNFVRPTSPSSSPCGAKRPNNSSKWGSGWLDWLCIVLNSFILMFSKYGGVLWNMFLWVLTVW